jgi:hypothetical protein
MPVQTPLNLVMPIADGELQNLVAVLSGLSQSKDQPLRNALKGLGNVHFAQFVFLEKGTRLGVFTIYDGDFDDYILFFRRTHRRSVQPHPEAHRRRRRRPSSLSGNTGTNSCASSASTT